MSNKSLPVISQKDMVEFLLGVAPLRPVFIWGPPGVGKSSLVEEFAAKMGLECVSLLGSQLSPEDVMGAPQIVDGRLQFCPPRLIARDKPYCLFLDELNACSDDVQKAFYSLIHDRKVGEYSLPPGSVVIAAGNRREDASIVKSVSSALINRMVNIAVDVSPENWLGWAERMQLHHTVIDYIRMHPDHLLSPPGEEETPFSTPRSWHMLSDTLSRFEDVSTNTITNIVIQGCLTREHADGFIKFYNENKKKAVPKEEPLTVNEPLNDAETPAVEEKAANSGILGVFRNS